jgi:hypothetical protein
MKTHINPDAIYITGRERLCSYERLCDKNTYEQDFIDMLEEHTKNIYRYNGGIPVSVWDHSHIISRYANSRGEFNWCKHHDIIESIMGDLTSFSKSLVGDDWKDAEKKMEEALFAKIRVFPQDIRKDLDLMFSFAETVVFWGRSESDYNRFFPPTSKSIYLDIKNILERIRRLGTKRKDDIRLLVESLDIHF